VIDIHSHILPEVDDGPKSWETAVSMCRMAVADGIDHMVATPHSNDRYFYDREYLSGLLQNLQQRVGDRPKLSLGCDFHLSLENMQAALVTPEKYRIANSRYLLVEFSNFGIPVQIDEWLGQMVELGTRPIITHPERNPILQQTGERVLQWVELGCAVQITASAITGSWGAKPKDMAQWFLKQKAVHFLATDAHDTARRPPVLSEARKVVAKQFGDALAATLVEENPKSVVNDQLLACWK
jgi:protein-tyrosine phosphatase